MSASAPAGSASKTIGRLVAVCKSATIIGADVSEVINHAAAISCIHIPTFEATAAIHSVRKSGSLRGLHAEVAAGCLTTPEETKLDEVERFI